MAKYSINDGDPVFFMESTSTGMVKLSIATGAVVVSPDTAEEIRALLALVVADAHQAKP